MIRATWRREFAQLHKGTDPQLVADEIGALDIATPETIVDKARDKTTELHKCFEWRDDVAAEKFRIIQARDIVRHLVILEETPPEERPEIRLFFKPQGSLGYQKTELILTRKDSYAALLETAMAELRAFKRKYSFLSELQEIFDLIK